MLLRGASSPIQKAYSSFGNCAASVLHIASPLPLPICIRFLDILNIFKCTSLHISRVQNCSLYHIQHSTVFHISNWWDISYILSGFLGPEERGAAKNRRRAKRAASSLSSHPQCPALWQNMQLYYHHNLRHELQTQYDSPQCCIMVYKS